MRRPAPAAHRGHGRASGPGMARGAPHATNPTPLGPRARPAARTWPRERRHLARPLHGADRGRRRPAADRSRAAPAGRAPDTAGRRRRSARRCCRWTPCCFRTCTATTWTCRRCERWPRRSGGGARGRGRADRRRPGGARAGARPGARAGRACTIRATPAFHKVRRRFRDVAALGFVSTGASTSRATPTCSARWPTWGRSTPRCCRYGAGAPAWAPGTWTRPAAAEAAALIGPRTAVPIHWGTYFPVHPGRHGHPLLRDPPHDFARLVGEQRAGRSRRGTRRW